ncbi:MAG: hypothetical protein AAGU11_18970 [Syntrophobacteraceae bacterium]
MHISIEQIRSELEKVDERSSLTVADLLGMPESLRRFLEWIVMARAVTCEQAAGFLEKTERETLSLIGELVARGLIEHVPTCGIPVYRVCLTPRRLWPPVEILRDQSIGGAKGPKK